MRLSRIEAGYRNYFSASADNTNQALMIPHILREPNSIIALLFIQNISHPY